MKIRTGFVSNSSSSSFVVLLPANLKEFEYKDLTDDCKNHLLENSNESGDDEHTLEKIYTKGLNNINTELRKLKQGKTLSQFHSKHGGVFECLEELLKPYILDSFDSGGGDGEGTIKPIDIKRVREILDQRS